MLSHQARSSKLNHYYYLLAADAFSACVARCFSVRCSMTLRPIRMKNRNRCGCARAHESWQRKHKTRPRTLLWTGSVFPNFQISQIGKHRMTTRDGIKSVATGNWGCGSRFNGNVQLKLVIQWMAASVAGLPVLVYHTAGHEKLAKVSVSAASDKACVNSHFSTR